MPMLPFNPCGPKSALVGTNMHVPMHMAWEHPPSWGRVTDTREKETPLTISQLESRGPMDPDWFALGQYSASAHSKRRSAHLDFPEIKSKVGLVKKKKTRLGRNRLDCTSGKKWLYGRLLVIFGCKAVVHGTSQLLEPPKTWLEVAQWSWWLEVALMARKHHEKQVGLEKSGLVQTRMWTLVGARMRYWITRIGSVHLPGDA
ncbi:hypothetical protein CRG98_007485 [Punica granatum]|uniref:Uncharacterized protein n=1 Tax=Punica granatum TaxID=22663 RepID=A0A2I0KUE7_PUNGR|nr:hypothetical protein CRG98_007485 [Punica granatum]